MDLERILSMSPGCMLWSSIDHILNLGTHIGLSPRKARQLTTPHFCIIDTNILSIARTIEENLTPKDIKGRCKFPLIVSDELTWKIAGEKLYSEFKDNRHQPGNLIISNSNYSDVEKVVKEVMGKHWKGSFLPFNHYDYRKLSCEQVKLEEQFGALTFGRRKYRFIVAVGGGSVIDSTQYASKKLNIPCIVVPTSLSNDGFASPFSVINLGEKLGVHTMHANVPFGIIVDTGLILSDDKFYERRIRSGIGDLFSNLNACLDWMLADSRGLDKVNTTIKALATDGAHFIADYILKDSDVFFDHTFLRELAARLYLSGKAMGEAESSRPSSGFCHKFYHALNEVYDYNLPVMHGEAVAIGALFSIYAHEHSGENTGLFNKFKHVYKLINLPTTKSDLSSLNLDIDKIHKAIDASVNIKKERYTILEHLGPYKMKEFFDKVYKIR